jgi:sugar phosphate isomerase/epimerase
MMQRRSRRSVLAACCAAAGATLLPGRLETLVNAQNPSSSSRPKSEPFGYCFNTSTIRGQRLPIEQVVDITAKAGWQGIEPWIDELQHHMQAGKSLKDLGKRIKDHGLTVPSAIGFAKWIVDDPAQRKAGLEHAKRDMEMVAQIGGTRVAAPPVGAQETGGIDLFAAAERYYALCELGRQIGVVPMVEVWGFSKQLQKLAEGVFVALQSGHPDANVLIDPYHLYKGGSPFEGVKLLSSTCLQHMHMNDYPADPPVATIEDAHRIYPGDGIAPLSKLFRELRDIGYTGMLSLELFSKALYAQDPLEVATTGLQKTRAAVQKAFA